MDIVLGVSMTPTTVRMVLVEGEKADGVTVDHDVFDVTPTDGSATSSAADQVVAAVLGTQESAAASGHHLKSIGVTWTRPLRRRRTARRPGRTRHRRRHARLGDARRGIARPGGRPRRRLRHHRAAVHREGHRHPVGRRRPTTARWSRCSAAICTTPTRWRCSPTWPAAVESAGVAAAGHCSSSAPASTSPR